MVLHRCEVSIKASRAELLPRRVNEEPLTNWKQVPLKALKLKALKLEVLKLKALKLKELKLKVLKLKPLKLKPLKLLARPHVQPQRLRCHDCCYLQLCCP